MECSARIRDLVCAGLATLVVGSIGAQATTADAATVTADLRGSETAELSEAGQRYVARLSLPAGKTAVIAEGDLEARSIGSYSVRVYTSDGARAGDDTTFYRSGIILERNGAIEDARLADIDGKSGDEIVVIVRSAGSGGYLSAHALSYANNQIEVRASVTELPADTDPIAALQQTAQKDKLKGKGKYHDPNGGAR